MIRRVGLLLVLAACEMDHAPPRPAPVRLVDLRLTKIPPLTLDVIVREYRTERPLANVPVIIEQRLNHAISFERTAPPTIHRSALTDATGRLHFELPYPKWYVTEVGPVPGYVTSCPFHNPMLNEQLDDETDSTYTCHLVAASMLVVRDRPAAIAAARREPEMKTWLATHRHPTIEAQDMVAAGYDIYFAEGNEQRLVIVDAIDGTADVGGRWE